MLKAEHPTENNPGGQETAFENESKTQSTFKVKFISKALVFSACVLTLSWFFAGWRMIHEAFNLYSLGVMLAGALSTLFLLSLQAFWIYADEKQKGRAVRRMPLFDRLLGELSERKELIEHQKICARERGDHV